MIGAIIAQFYPYCGTSVKYHQMIGGEDINLLLYPLAPKDQGIRLEEIPYPKPHITKPIDLILSDAERSELQTCEDDSR